MVCLGGDISNRDQTWQGYIWMLTATTPHDSRHQGEGWGRVILNTGKSTLGSNLFSPLVSISSIPILRPTVLQPKTFLTGGAQWTAVVREGCMKSLPTSYKATLEVSWVAAALFNEKDRVTDFRLLPSVTKLLASARLSKVSLCKARKAGTRQLPHLDTNLHSSSALGLTFYTC